MKNIIFIALNAALLSACGTYTPIPSHGGGKRFAVEQALVSATFRQVMSELPLEKLKDKKVLLELSIITDDGGGSLNGGRPQLMEILSAQNKSIDTALLGQKVFGFSSSRGESLYSKDMSFNNSDSVFFINLMSSTLARQNILINPKAENEGQADYLLEIIVDVMGTWRSKTDWMVSNSERIKAVTSIEYVVTPIGAPSDKRVSGRISYEAEYLENYVGWMGPTHTSMVLRKSEIGAIIPSLGNGTDSYTNLFKGRGFEFNQPEKNQPIQFNPKMK